MAGVATPSRAALDPELVYEQLARVRLFEDELELRFLGSDHDTVIHTAPGQEAVAVGVHAALEEGDVVFSTHRGYHHAIACGLDLRRLAAETFGRRTGFCGGRGGHMHIVDLERGFAGGNGIVGGGLALAVGAGYAFQRQARSRVSVAFFGDGASNTGLLHEALNLAAVWGTPTVFVCENNGFAEMTATAAVTAGETIAARAAPFGIPGTTVDGTSVEAVYEAASSAVARARRGEGPSFVEARVCRLKGHFVGDAQHYRMTQPDDRDPLALWESASGLDEATAQRVRERVGREVASAVDAGYADADLRPDEVDGPVLR